MNKIECDDSRHGSLLKTYDKISDVDEIALVDTAMG